MKGYKPKTFKEDVIMKGIVTYAAWMFVGSAACVMGFMAGEWLFDNWDDIKDAIREKKNKPEEVEA